MVLSTQLATSQVTGLFLGLQDSGTVFSGLRPMQYHRHSLLKAGLSCTSPEP